MYLTKKHKKNIISIFLIYWNHADFEEDDGLYIIPNFEEENSTHVIKFNDLWKIIEKKLND